MADNTTNITPPRVPFLDARNNQVSREWYRFFLNLFTNTGGGTGVTPVINGGTGVATIPANGELLIGNGSGYTVHTLNNGQNITVTNGVGTIEIALSGIVPIANGGTATSDVPGVGELLIGDGTSYQVQNLTSGQNILITNGAGSITIALTGIVPIANGGTNSSATPIAGAVPYGTGTAYDFTAVGTAGQVLTSAGAGTPTWATPTTGTVTSVNVSGGTTGLTTSGGPITSSGTITLAGTLIAANGGTGYSTYTIGDILYASSTTALSKLADVATGNSLISGGVGAAPSWGKIGLTTHVSGTLPIANGGTGQITANAALNALLPSQTANAGKVLSTNGTDTSWIDGGSSGTYTPTLTNSTNVAASTTGGCQYMQVGSVVTVSGQLSVDPTAASTVTVIYISLPIASNFSSSRNAAGSAASIQNIYGEVGGILGDTVNDRFELRLFPTSTANQSYSFHATYFVQ